MCVNAVHSVNNINTVVDLDANFSIMPSCTSYRENMQDSWPFNWSILNYILLDYYALKTATMSKLSTAINLSLVSTSTL